MMTAEKIAQCDRFEYWLINDKDIYRVGHGYILDNSDIPLGMRWECPLHMWESKLSYSPFIQLVAKEHLDDRAT